MIRSRSSNGAKAHFMRVDRQPLHLAEADPERLVERRELGRHRDAAHQPVVGVERDPEAQPPEQVDRVLPDRGGGAGVDVRGRAHLERDSPIADERRQPAQLHRAVVADVDVVDDPDAVAQPLGPAELERLPDRRQPERLAGVDRDVEVLAADVVEGVEVAGRRDSPPRARRCRSRRPRRRASGPRIRRPRPIGPPGASP